MLNTYELMPNTDPEPTQVAVGLVFDTKRRVLIGQRTTPVELKGKWEFPGGKIKINESDEEALNRELWEEVGIRVVQSAPFMSMIYAYSNTTVNLKFRTVFEYKGFPVSREQQNIRWVEVDKLHQSDLLPANVAVVEKLQNEYL